MARSENLSESSFGTGSTVKLRMLEDMQAKEAERTLTSKGGDSSESNSDVQDDEELLEKLREIDPLGGEDPSENAIRRAKGIYQGPPPTGNGCAELFGILFRR